MFKWKDNLPDYVKLIIAGLYRDIGIYLPNANSRIIITKLYAY